MSIVVMKRKSRIRNHNNNHTKPSIMNTSGYLASRVKRGKFGKNYKYKIRHFTRNV